VTLLLDTHVLLWALARPADLAREVRRKVESAANSVFVSAVSAWEIEIKRALRKLRAPTDLAEQLGRARFTELPVHLRHVDFLRGLPDLHRDPFDRLLIAQAISDDLTLVSADPQVLAYPVRTLRA
jgi:PIN domain nuclease of toxin-antitoxin system